MGHLPMLQPGLVGRILPPGWGKPAVVQTHLQQSRTLHFPPLQSQQGAAPPAQRAVLEFPGSVSPRVLLQSSEGTWGAAHGEFNGLLGKWPGRHTALTFR